MNVYTFPFDTCETPKNNGIAQPYSVFINLISCLIIFYFLLQTKNYYAFILLLSLLLFELFHTLSHFIHIKGKFLYTSIHINGFLINLSLLHFLYRYTNKLPNIYYIIFLLLILLCDIYFFFNFSFIYFVLTQFILLVAILFYYYNFLPTNVQYNLKIILVSIFIIYIAFINEKINCKNMLKLYPNFPFHMIIEMLGIIPIYLLSYTFYNL